MAKVRRRRLTVRDRAVVIGLVIMAVLTAAPGVHAFESWLPPRVAFLVSHGLALVLLGVTALEWRRRASRPHGAGHAADPMR